MDAAAKTVIDFSSAPCACTTSAVIATVKAARTLRLASTTLLQKMPVLRGLVVHVINRCPEEREWAKSGYNANIAQMRENWHGRYRCGLMSAKAPTTK